MIVNPFAWVWTIWNNNTLTFTVGYFQFLSFFLSSRPEDSHMETPLIVLHIYIWWLFENVTQRNVVCALFQRSLTHTSSQLHSHSTLTIYYFDTFFFFYSLFSFLLENDSVAFMSFGITRVSLFLFSRWKIHRTAQFIPFIDENRASFSPINMLYR